MKSVMVRDGIQMRVIRANNRSDIELLVKIKIIAISNSLCCFQLRQRGCVRPLARPSVTINFLQFQIPSKSDERHQSLKIFSKMVILVGWAGRLKNGRSHLKRSFSQQRVLKNLHTKFKPKLMKIYQVMPIEILIKFYQNRMKNTIQKIFAER